MPTIKQLVATLAVLVLLASQAIAADPWVVYQGGNGPGKGKHVVLISGDEEYRSEEFLPQLGKILAKHHGFTCTVLFAVNPADGSIDPNNQNNIPGLAALKNADLATDHRHPHGHPRLQHSAGQEVLEVQFRQPGVGWRLRPADFGRNVDRPPRATRL